MTQTTRQVQIDSAKPLTSIGPSSSTSKHPSVRRCVAGPIRIVFGCAACWSRAATLTASPVANVDSTASTTTSPDSIPTLASRPSSLTESMIESAARTARSASSSCAVGTPNAAMTASPANFSTIPPCETTHCWTRSKYCCTRRRATSGSVPETSAVDPTRSTNRTVASLRSTPTSVETTRDRENVPSYQPENLESSRRGSARRVPTMRPVGASITCSGLWSKATNAREPYVATTPSASAPKRWYRSAPSTEYPFRPPFWYHASRVEPAKRAPHAFSSSVLVVQSLVSITERPICFVSTRSVPPRIDSWPKTATFPSPSQSPSRKLPVSGSFADAAGSNHLPNLARSD